MRTLLFAAVAMASMLVSGAEAATGPKVGPSDSWTRMQKFEYHVGQISGALNLCGNYALANDLKELADLSPYARKGWASLQPFDSIKSGQCAGIAESAREVLADRDRLWAYLTEKYDCPGGECAPDEGDVTASATCRAEADEYLTSLPIDADDIRSVKMLNGSGASTQMRNGKKGHEAWARLNSCSGWLIVVMSKGCTPQQTFTQGDCAIEGISSY